MEMYIFTTDETKGLNKFWKDAVPAGLPGHGSGLWQGLTSQTAIQAQKHCLQYSLPYSCFLSD